MYVCMCVCVCVCLLRTCELSNLLEERSELCLKKITYNYQDPRLQVDNNYMRVHFTQLCGAAIKVATKNVHLFFKT